MAESKWTRHEVQFRGVPNACGGCLVRSGPEIAKAPRSGKGDATRFAYHLVADTCSCK